MTILRCCENCEYFLQEELPTGYCRFHEMYVLMDFDCGKFEQRHTLTEGGDELPEKLNETRIQTHDVFTEDDVAMADGTTFLTELRSLV